MSIKEDPASSSAADFFTNGIDYLAAGVTIGVIAGVITWTAAIATAIWAVFRAMNEIHRWQNRHGRTDNGRDE
jgi:hypothetical protein